LPLAAIAAGGDLGAGPGLVTLALPGLPPASPLICYEAIFPHEVAAKPLRPAWLLNVTNDAWFGLTAGPHQDFSMARMRTIEEGLPLARAANNGISRSSIPMAASWTSSPRPCRNHRFRSSGTPPPDALFTRGRHSFFCFGCNNFRSFANRQVAVRN